MNLKTCTKCNKELPVSEFHKNKRSNDGLRPTCKGCVSDYKKEYRKKNKDKLSTDMKIYYQKNRTGPEKLLANIKKRAKTKGLDFNLTIDDIKIPEFCPLLGLKLEVAEGGKASPNSRSLDRIDPKKGYVKGNVWVISNKANMIKNDATLSELKMLVSNLEKFLLQQPQVCVMGNKEDE